MICSGYYKPPTRSVEWPQRGGIRKIVKGRAATGAHKTKMKAQYQTFRTRYNSFLWYAQLGLSDEKIFRNI